MQKIKICKWETYQQYKDRNPTWVKLHKALLSSRTWVMLDNDGRALMVALMMLACTCEGGLIPNDPAFICRVAYFKKIDITPLVSLGFIELIQYDTETYETVQESTPSVSVSVSVSSLNDSIETKNKKSKDTENYNNYSNETFDIDNWKKQDPNVMVKWPSTEGIPEEFGDYAEKLGFFPDRIHREAAKFHGYWTLGTGAGKRRVPRRWFQSWQNWINKAAKGE